MVCNRRVLILTRYLLYFHATLREFSFLVNCRCSVVPHFSFLLQCYSYRNNKISMIP
jgi:hypothetical protein